MKLRADAAPVADNNDDHENYEACCEPDHDSYQHLDGWIHC